MKMRERTIDDESMQHGGTAAGIVPDCSWEYSGSGRATMSDNEVIQDFLMESYENLDRLDCDLVELEKNLHDKVALVGVFRTIHTIKGICGFLGFSKLEKVAHVGENLLKKLRGGNLILNPEIMTASRLSHQ
jgi:chemotaxis protein histidine kinase CheA